MHVGAEAQARELLDAGGGGVLISDGTAATPAVWHMSAVAHRPGYVAGPQEVTEQLLDAVRASDYDLILLLAPDIEWVADGVRDDPQGRDDAFALYRRLYPQAQVISGPSRVSEAIHSVSRALPTVGGSG